MARFTATENKLISQIKDDRLTSSLAKIREALEDLWPSDSVRLVLHYTDHGVRHSERVANYASLILKANKRASLTDQEMYLLLAGIYLHDIGMQCDVVKFSEIADKAERIGAKFDIKFEFVNGVFSEDMQKSIRKNHQYLSAAWIDLASRTGDTRLGTAAMEIPKNLVDDLMDICKYHSRLSIKKCPLKFKFSQIDRKQLVAAILRFADELDIDSHRASLETVKNFSIDPDNGVYWWLHNRTSISFITPNLISIILQLHPNDNDNYGPLIKHLFIEKFCKKNEPLIDILFENHIQLHISSDSGVVENDRIELLPDYIVSSLQKMEKCDKISVEIDKLNPQICKNKNNRLSYESEAKPEFYHLYNNACDLFQSCKYEESLITYEQVIRIDPEFALAWTNKGIVLENLGRYNEALEAYESSIKRDPNQALAWSNQGIILRKMGKYDYALKSLDKSIELGPNNALAWIHKGMILENLGRYKEALGVYRTAIELEPNYSPVLTCKVTYLERICRYKAAKESKEIDAYLETEKEISEEIEIKAILNEEANRLSQMDLEAAEEAEVKFEESQDTYIHHVEEQASSLHKAKKDERSAFLKKMDAIAKEEKTIETAEAQEIVDSYLETEKEIVEEMEMKSLLKEEANLLLLMDKEAEVDAEIEVDKRYCLDILIIDIEKIIARLKKAKDEERADFLKNMDKAARNEWAIEVAEEQETISYLETEKEYLDEIESKALQNEEAFLLSQMDLEAAEEAEIETEPWHIHEIHLAKIEKIAALLDVAKEKEKADFLEKMDRVARYERTIEVAEEQETISYLETEKEFLDEIESKALQKEEATLLSLMDKGAKEEAEIEIDRWLGPDIHIVEFEERTALLNKAKEKEKTDFLKKMEGVAKDEWTIDVAEAQETASYLETVKEFLVECETIALQKEEATLLSIMDQEAIEEAGMELDSEVWKDLESYLAEERATFLKKMNEEARNEKDLEEYLEKKRKLWGQKEGFAC